MDRDPVYLSDILDSARRAHTYVEGVSRSEFLRDVKLQDSVVRRLEIVGEAAGRLSPEFRQEHPTVPWGRMTGMRNRMIHGYRDVDMELVWETVQRHIPPLILQLEALLPPEAE